MPARSSFSRAIGVIAMVAVLLVILYESSQARGQPGVLELTTNEAYVAHFVIYGVMVFCAMMAIGRPSPGILVAVLLFAAGLGVAMELYQADVPTRAASAADALADVAGAASGLFAYVLFWMLLEPRPEQPTKL